MWKEKISYGVSWAGKTIWDNYYSDHTYFDTEKEAIDFSKDLQKKEGVYYVRLEKNISWEKDN